MNHQPGIIVIVVLSYCPPSALMMIFFPIACPDGRDTQIFIEAVVVGVKEGLKCKRGGSLFDSACNNRYWVDLMPLYCMSEIIVFFLTVVPCHHRPHRQIGGRRLWGNVNNVAG